MSILILGNGFDLAHGLNTRYTDFLEYVLNKKKLISEEQVVGDELIKHNVWIDYLCGLHNRNLLCGINWIDFEMEISHILKIFDEQDSNVHNQIVELSKINDDTKMVLFYNLYARHYSNGEGVKGVPKKTYSDLINDLGCDLENLIKEFEMYLIEKVEKCDVLYRSPDIQAVNAKKIINFNYTHIFEDLYSEDKTKVHHIHGETKIKDSCNMNMVLGVDEYWERGEAHKHTNYNIFKKFTQRVLMETGFTYRYWIEESKKEYARHVKTRMHAAYENTGITDVYIFGHSLDATDSDILREFFLEDCFRVHIFYKDKPKEAVLIANVVKMVGEDEFIRQINTVPAKLEFIKQKEMILLKNE